MTIHVLVSSLSFFFILEPALSFHAWTPNASYKLQRTGYHCQFAKCLSSNTAHKKISEESQDTFTCQETNVNALGGSKGSKLKGLIHNHSAAKTFSTDASGQHICHYEGFWHILITGQRYGMMTLLREVGGKSVPAEHSHYPVPASVSMLTLFNKNQFRIAYDTILSAFISYNCFLQKIILIAYLPWNKLSEWKITSGLKSD